MIKGSWKTTILGIFALVGSLMQIGVAMLDSDVNSKPNFEAFLVAATGLGLMFARDDDVTSERSGAAEASK